MPAVSISLMLGTIYLTKTDKADEITGVVWGMSAFRR